MSFADMHYLIALANLAVCIAIMVICGCRVDVMSMRTKLHVRLVYAFLFVAAMVSGFQPHFFHEWPGKADLLLNSALLGLLISGRALWPKAPPTAYLCSSQTEVRKP